MVQLGLSLFVVVLYAVGDSFATRYWEFSTSGWMLGLICCVVGITLLTYGD